MPIPDFRAGDIIDADELHAYLVQLDGRISILEQAATRQGQVVVTQLIPATDIRINEELRILGREFYFSRGAAMVRLNGLQREIKAEVSNDNELRIDIPTGTPLGTATVRVSNSFTFVDRTINILPAQIPLTGNPTVTFLRVQPTQILTGGSMPVRRIFIYELDATPMSRETTFTVDPLISVTEWDRTAQIVVDENGVSRSNEFRLAPRQKTTFGVAVDLVAVAGPPTSFTMRLDLTAEGRAWHLADRTFRHGETVLPANPGILLSSPSVAPNRAFDDATNTITGQAVLSIQADFTAPDTYTLIAAGVDGSNFAGSNWTGSLGLTLPSIVVTSAMITAGGRKHSEVIEINFTPQAGALRLDIEVGYRTTNSKTVETFTLVP